MALTIDDSIRSDCKDGIETYQTIEFLLMHSTSVADYTLIKVTVLSLERPSSGKRLDAGDELLW